VSTQAGQDQRSENGRYVTYTLDLTVVNPAVDPTFAFMTVDHDGKIRMDCL